MESLFNTASKSLFFNRDIAAKASEGFFPLINSIDDFLQVSSLRSEVYTEMGYDSECNEIEEGYNYDDFDKESAIFCIKEEGKVIASLRIIFSDNLPSAKYSKKLRSANKKEKILEVSRVVVEKNNRGRGLFKTLYRLASDLAVGLGINKLAFVVNKDHEVMFSDFNNLIGLEILSSYGSIEQTSIVYNWEIKKDYPNISPKRESRYFNEVLVNAAS